MKNRISDGAVIDWTNATGSAVVSGQVVRVGQQLGVATVDIAAGAVGVVALEGDFSVPKVTVDVIAVGETMLWDASAAKFAIRTATPASGDVLNAVIAREAGTNGMTSIVASFANRVGTVTP